MELHHDKHHATYVSNLNAAEEKLKVSLEKNDIAGIVILQSAIRFNGGGHLNHSIFWQNLSANGGQPSADLAAAINNSFGNFDNFRKNLSEQTVAIQGRNIIQKVTVILLISSFISGSGWGWLGYCPISKQLKIATCPNQDPLLTHTGNNFFEKRLKCYGTFSTSF